ncbi:MBL fold metallo-hydrolase [Candidatus Micrarchaeota archaeon]|nr:MBL fold metallo-hydrolase [Candidatus Micrarchaeota archaeon]
MKIRFLGACREVGRSCFEVDASETKLLLDCGTSNPVRGRPLVPPLKPNGKVDAIILSHAHLDHTGYIPGIYKHQHVEAYATPPSIPVSQLLWFDTIKVSTIEGVSAPFSERDAKQACKHMQGVNYGEQFDFESGASFKFTDAAHILGSAQVTVRDGNKTLLYSGDFKMEQTRLLEGCKPAEKNVDALLVESTYYPRYHPPRKKLEADFIDSVKQALDDGGNVLLPAFAVGRTQELMMILNAYNIRAPIYLDGMGNKTTQITSDFSSYLRSEKEFFNALDQVYSVEKTDSKKKIAREEGNVIIATAGMLDGGPALTYLREMNQLNKGTVILSGYQAEGSNGRSLIQTGVIKDDGKKTKVRINVKWHSFSAHAGTKDLIEYVKQVNPRKVFCIHGDEQTCISFADYLKKQGFDASAPKAGTVSNI